VEVSRRLLHDLPGDCNGVMSAEGEAGDPSADLRRHCSIGRVSHWAPHWCHCRTLWAPTAATDGGGEPCQALLSLSRVLGALPHLSPWM